MLSLLELLQLRGFRLNPKRTKIVRHKDSRWDIHRLRREGTFEWYQSFQSRPVFDGCDHIVVCIGEDGTRSRFVGIYEVGRCEPGDAVELPAHCPPAFAGKYHYALTKVPGYEDLEDRVVIEWGPGALAWHQRLTDREVLEISPAGRTRPPFRDYLEFTLTHEELVDLVRHAEGNRDWRARLEAVGGVYLILATTTGQQYVGSATGTGGVWGRWKNYAQTGHGGNKALITLLASDPAYPNSFQYSLLYIFPKTLTEAEALERERRCKEKLGTRAYGLTRN